MLIDVNKINGKYEVTPNKPVDDNKEVTIDVSEYTEPVEVTSDTLMRKATVTVTNIPVIEENVAKSIDVSSYTAPVEIEPTEGKDGMAKATVTLTNIPSPGGNVESSKGATINVSEYSGPVTVLPTSGYNAMAQTVITLTDIPQGGDPLYVYGHSEAAGDYGTVLVPEELSTQGGVVPYLYLIGYFDTSYYENVHYAYNEDYGSCSDIVYEFAIGDTTVYTDVNSEGTIYAKSIPQYPVAIFGSSKYSGQEGASYVGNLFACTSATYLSGNGGTASGYIYEYATDTWTYVSNETYTFVEASGDCEENHISIHSVGIIANTYNPSTNHIEPSVVMPTTPGGN